jgi:hypothetical protein
MKIDVNECERIYVIPSPWALRHDVSALAPLAVVSDN